MSAGNYFLTRKKGFDLRTITLTNVLTYTAKVGSSSENFIEDRVIKVVTIADGNNLTLTIPAGTYAGQRMLLIWDTLGHDETVTVTVSGAATVTFTGEDAYASLEWVNSTAGWVSLAAAVT